MTAFLFRQNDYDHIIKQHERVKLPQGQSCLVGMGLRDSHQCPLLEC